MRAPLRLAVVALLAALSAGPAAAEPIGKYFYLVPFGGLTVFDGDLRFPRANLVDEFNLGGRLGYQWSPWLGLEAGGGFTATNEDTTGGADVDFFHMGGDVVFTPYRGRWGGPFAFVGFGMSQLKPSAGGDDVKQGNVEVGGGLNLWLTDAIGLRVEGRDLLWMNKDDMGKVETQTLVLGAGITVALGARGRDTDEDGVPDRKDKCPGTPRGATVDAKGCPSDSDSDGVFDGIDACAATPAGAQVDEKGCPKDEDGDGVFDGLDKCPGTAAGLKVDKDGCPIEITERETELLDTGMIRLQDVNFETGKADLLPESLPRLDIVGEVLSKWPQLRVEIGGHTDSRGSNANNQKLSEARANSVRTYLSGKFPQLQAGQFTTRGYGESKPLVPNTGDLNMAKNRRVEFVVLNKEVLKKESERRRLLKEGEGAPAGDGKQ